MNLFNNKSKIEIQLEDITYVIPDTNLKWKFNYNSDTKTFISNLTRMLFSNEAGLKRDPIKASKAIDVEKTYFFLFNKIQNNKKISKVEKDFLSEIFNLYLKNSNKEFGSNLEVIHLNLNIGNDFAKRIYKFFFKEFSCLEVLREAFQNQRALRLTSFQNLVQNGFEAIFDEHAIKVDHKNKLSYMNAYQLFILQLFMNKKGYLAPILLGDEDTKEAYEIGINSLLPKNRNPFMMKESGYAISIKEINESLPKLKSTQFLSSTTTWLEDFLKDFTAALPVDTIEDDVDDKNVSLETKPTSLRSAVDVFFTDFDRFNVSYYINSTRLSNVSDLLFSYQNYLIMNPQKVSEELNKQKKSPFFKKIVSEYPELIHESQPWTYLLEQLLKNTHSEKIKKALSDCVKWNERELLELSKHCPGIKLEDIRQILPKKLFQLMVCLNQSIFALLTIKTSEYINKNQTFDISLQAGDRSITFTQDLSSFLVKGTYKSFLSNEVLNKEFNVWQNSFASEVLEVTSEFSVMNFDSFNGTIIYHPCFQVNFNLFCPFKLIENFSNLIGASIVPYSKKLFQKLFLFSDSEKELGSPSLSNQFDNLTIQLKKMDEILNSFNAVSEGAITFDLHKRVFKFRKLKPVNEGEMPFKTLANIKKLIMGLNATFEETIEINNLIKGINNSKIEKFYFTHSFIPLLNHMKKLKKTAKEARFNTLFIVSRIEDNRLSNYILKLTDSAFLLVESFFSSFNSNLRNCTKAKPYVFENKTYMPDAKIFKRFQNYRKELESVEIVNGVLKLPQTLLSDLIEFIQVKEQFSEEKIKKDISIIHNKIMTPVLSTVMSAQKSGAIWFPIPINFKAGESCYSHVSQELENFKFEIDIEGHIVITCSAVHTNHKAWEFKEGIASALAIRGNEGVDQPLRIVMHQFNSFANSEKKLIEEQNEISRKLEMILKNDDRPVLAHLNNAINFTTSLPWEQSQSTIQNLEGFATLLIWAMEDLKDLNFEDGSEMAQIYLALKEINKDVQVLRGQILNSKTKVANSLEGLQAKMKDKLKLYSKLAFILGGKIEVKDSFDENSKYLFLKAQNIFQVLGYALAMQAGCAKELGQSNLSRCTEMELHLILDMLLNCVTSINCKSGLDRTGLVRSCWDSLRTMWRGFQATKPMKKLPKKIREQLAYQDLLLMIMQQDKFTKEIDKAILGLIDKKRIQFVTQLDSDFKCIEPTVDLRTKLLHKMKKNLMKTTQSFEKTLKDQIRAWDYLNLVMKHLVSNALTITMESRGTPGLKYGQDGNMIDQFFANPHPLNRIPMFISNSEGKLIRLYEMSGWNNDFGHSMTEAGKQILLGFTKFEKN